MARETKVGLLVGLAFIICFAVILSNRGREETLATAAPFLPDVNSKAPTQIAAVPSHAVELPAGGQPGSGTHLSAGSGLPSGGNALPMTEPVVTHGEGDLERKVRELEEQLARVSAGVPATQPSAPGPAEQSVAMAPRNAGTVASSPEPTTASAGRRPAADQSTAYTVRAGDTLFSIAHGRYGSSSQRVVDAIIAANRQELRDPNQIRPGMVLRLPKLDDAAPKPVQRASDHPGRAIKRPTEGPSKSPSFSWYQVRKNDRYASIARELLGDGGRWREIHELNKDKFPNPDQIREGVRIKIPSRAGG